MMHDIESGMEIGHVLSSPISINVTSRTKIIGQDLGDKYQARKI